MQSFTPEYVFTRDYVDNNRGSESEDSRRRYRNWNLRWLTDLGAKIPSTVQLDGLDVSFDAMPPREWLPPNVALYQCDINKEFPSELMRVCGIVHIRKFAFVLQNDTIPAIIANLLKLLKPNGYLQ
ncbi:hypothetical protein HYALB_00012838 [Hymenoscyphus albidus]|uniref:Uncharacterized protein n=1 Tax=Hymenoscyphus albidus TaxID=595503 RepID=A0A9N9LVU5_9HELO|nr:hypothetical protein HYALB_00012838 [Hymenoscyphus albidus]